MSGLHSHSHGHAHHHGHEHNEHGHDHHCPSNGASAKRLLIAAGLTGSFMIVEIFGGYISGSLALLADAGHMFTDFFALIAAYIGVKLAAKAKTEQQKRTPIYIALGNGLFLYALAGWIIFEAWQRLQTPIDVLSTPMLIIAIIGLGVNLIVFKILMGGDRGNLNMRGAMLHVLGDMLGSIAAITAALIIMATGYMIIDPLLSALVAVLIILSAFPLLRDSGRALKTRP